MKISTEEKTFQQVTIVLESKKELACIMALAESTMRYTFNEAAKEAGIEPDDLDEFLGELYHGIEGDC